MTNTIYPVQNDSGKTLVLATGGVDLTGQPTTPVFSTDGRPMIIRHGNDAFGGSGGPSMQKAVYHGLERPLVWCEIMPALAYIPSSGYIPWGGSYYQWAPADNNYFYIATWNVAGPGYVYNYGAGTYYFNWRVEALLS